MADEDKTFEIPDTVDSLDNVPEALHRFYEQDEKSGKFNLADVSALRSTVKNVKTERNQAREKAKQVERWEKLGKSPEEIEELLAARAEAEEKKAREEGNFEHLLQQHRERADREKAELQKELEASRLSERSAIIENRLVTALTKAGATEEGLDLLPDRLSPRVEISTKEGKRVITIRDAEGHDMAGAGSDGRATFEDLVTEAKKKWPSLFQGTGKGGSGASNNNGGGGAPDNSKNLKRSQMSTADKAAYVREHGQQAFLKLPA